MSLCCLWHACARDARSPETPTKLYACPFDLSVEFMACRVWVSRSAEEICEREFLRSREQRARSADNGLPHAHKKRRISYDCSVIGPEQPHSRNSQIPQSRNICAHNFPARHTHTPLPYSTRTPTQSKGPVSLASLAGGGDTVRQDATRGDLKVSCSGSELSLTL